MKSERSATAEPRPAQRSDLIYSCMCVPRGTSTMAHVHVHPGSFFLQLYIQIHITHVICDIHGDMDIGYALE